MRVGYVVYLRIENDSGMVNTILVIAKTKVAPIKRLMIPRLELCGAVLLAKMLCHVGKVLTIPTNSIYAWTDSIEVLSWLQGNSRRFRPFVGNRVSTILEATPLNSWRHVDGPNNPAD